MEIPDVPLDEVRLLQFAMQLDAVESLLCKAACFTERNSVTDRAICSIWGKYGKTF